MFITTYVKPHCSKLIVYPTEDRKIQPDYRFEYSDANSFRTHELGTTVTITCYDSEHSEHGEVVSYAENKSYIAREKALTATCSNVNGQYTWTIRGLILHYVDCIIEYVNYCQ
ncbi:hypothetical protein Ddc_18073 [Ditylenchus destructor]|nr:hypothetical protein Ddc_18073 [Ditylenchus destructor]